MSTLAIAAMIAWAGALYERHLFLRRGTTPMARSYWFVLLFIAIGLTLLEPGVYAWINDRSGVPHLSRWLSNACGVLAIFATQNAVYLGLLSARRNATARALALVMALATLAAMAFLFLSATPLDSDLPFGQSYGRWQITWYRVAYLSYMATGIAAVTLLWARYTLISSPARLKASFGLMTAGGLLGVGYVANDFGGILAAVGSRAPGWWGQTALTDKLIASATTLVFAGAMMEVWLGAFDNFRSHLACLRLRRLWSELAKACPQYILLPALPWWREVLDIRDARFRLRRRVTEIQDTALWISRFGDARAGLTALDKARSMGLSLDEAEAVAGAAVIMTGLSRLNGHRQAGSDPPRSQGPATWVPDIVGLAFWDQVRYLIQLSHHLGGRRFSQIFGEPGTGVPA